jgi:hypothetical protein
MTVSTRQPRISGSERELVGVNGGGSSAEARAWLASRLRWEERLQELEHVAGHTPGPPARLPDRTQKAG